MTKSELFAVMTGGLASVAGSVLVGYSLLGVPLEYLLAASFMAAPAGLVMAKLFVPETDDTPEPDSFKMEADSDSANVIDAAAKGASVGLQLALNIRNQRTLHGLPNKIALSKIDADAAAIIEFFFSKRTIMANTPPRRREFVMLPIASVM